MRVRVRMQDVFNETRSILEPAGAVGVAGAKAWLKHHKHKVGGWRWLCWVHKAL